MYSCRPLVSSIWDCFDANGTFEDAFVNVEGKDRIAVASEIMPYSFSSAEMLELHTYKVTSAGTHMLKALLPPGGDDAKHAEGSIHTESSEALFMSLKQRYTLHILPRRPFILHSVLVLELTRPQPDVRIKRFRDVVLYRPPLSMSGKPAALRPLPFMPHPLRRLAGMSAWAFFAMRQRMQGK